MKPMRILLVEEDAQDYLSIRQFLDEQGGKSQIDWAPNYESATKLVKQNVYDIYLIGYYARQVKQRAFLSWLYQYTTVPVILLLKPEENIQELFIDEFKTEYLHKDQLNWTLLQKTIRYVSQLMTVESTENRFRQIFEQAASFIALIDNKGHLLELNHIACQFAQTPKEMLIGKLIWDIGWIKQHFNIKTQLRNGVTTASQGKRYHQEVEGQDNQQQKISLDLVITPLRNKQGDINELLVEGHDLSRCKQTEQELINATLHDPLTGLPNRQFFIEQLERALEQLDSDDQHLALLFIDIDRFRLINESLGHDMGDWLLMEIAHRLQSCLKENTLLSRSSGDEFMVLLKEIDNLTEATQLATTINQELAFPFTLDGYEIVTSASIGIAYGNHDHRDSTSLLRDVDTAMYRAKSNGRSRHAVYNQSMHHSKALSRLKIEADLHRGVAEKDFVLFYQPQAELAHEKIIGVESLLRFDHPQKGLISPLEFINILEDMGAIISLGEWILRTACLEFSHWLQEAQLPLEHLSINLSAHQFRSKNLYNIVSEAIKEANLRPEQLELELTESLLLEDTESAQKTLFAFQDMGIRVTIDNFGTGYASLSYLRQFPINSLKIDKSFIQGIHTSPQDTAIIVATIDMAHALGLTVIAEGVETIEQRNFLQDHGCDAAQGYLYAPAMAGKDFNRWAQQYTRMNAYAQNQKKRSLP